MASTYTSRIPSYKRSVHQAIARAAVDVGEMLKSRLIADHPWQNQRPHTEQSIEFEVYQVSVFVTQIIMKVDYDAGLWLELFHGGRWAWMWQTVIDSEADIYYIIALHLAEYGFIGATGSLEVIMNTAKDAEAESAKQLMYAAR